MEPDGAFAYLLENIMAWSKKAWVRIIRNEYKVRERKPCFICGDHELITHAHHLYDVAHMANILEIANISPATDDLLVEYVWLCPNHHAYWHKIHEKNKSQEVIYSEKFNDREVAMYSQLNEVTQKFHDKFMKWVMDNRNSDHE